MALSRQAPGPALDAEHRGRGYGIRVNVTGLLPRPQAGPVRKLIKARGFHVKLAGIRGEADDKRRGFRAYRDGPIYPNRESEPFRRTPSWDGPTAW